MPKPDPNSPDYLSAPCLAKAISKLTGRPVELYLSENGDIVHLLSWVCETIERRHGAGGILLNCGKSNGKVCFDSMCTLWEMPDELSGNKEAEFCSDGDTAFESVGRNALKLIQYLNNRDVQPFS